MTHMGIPGDADDAEAYTADEILTDCATCGHPDGHHDAGECWTLPDGSECWSECWEDSEYRCRCSWYRPSGATWIAGQR